MEPAPPPAPGPLRGRPVRLALAVALFVAMECFLRLDPLQRNAVSVLALMAFLWISEALPLWATSLLPFVLFPLFRAFPQPVGALGPAASNALRTGEAFFDQTLGLFLGGMCLGAAIQVTGLHRRWALAVLSRVGTSRAGLVFGFLLATALVSMWISNTATAVMMLPIAVSVLRQVRAWEGRPLPGFAAALVLAVAYGANIGGIGTKIGTLPNVMFSGFAEKRLGVSVDFVHYLRIGLPEMLLLLPVALVCLLVLSRHDSLRATPRELIARQRAALGPMTAHEKAALAFFALAACLWIFGRYGVEAIQPHLPQYARWATADALKRFDSIVAMAVALLMMTVPVRGRPVVDGSVWRYVSWEGLALLGGGFAVAASIQESGFTKVAAQALGEVAAWPPLVSALVVSGVTVFVSAFSSNTATCAVMLPVVHAAFRGASLPYLALVGVSSSLDFALPAGTPPNAIVFGSGEVRVAQMVKVGVVLDLLAAIAASLWILAAARIGWL